MRVAPLPWRSGAAAVFLLVLFLPGLASAAAEPPADEAESTTEETQQTETSTPAEETITLADFSPTVTDALQGKEGVRIQTLCTHCNSANIQVGGLGQDLVPLSQDGYPIIGGLATSLILSILPADTIAEAKVIKGPGEAAEPYPAAGGVISLSRAQPSDLPWFELSAGAGTFSRQFANLRFAGELASRLSGSVTAGVEKADAVDDDGDGFNDVGIVDRQYVDARAKMSFGSSHTVDLGLNYIEEDNLEGRGAFDVLGFFGDPSPQWTREDTFLDRRGYRGGWTREFRNGGRFTLRGLAASRQQRVASQITRLGETFGGPEATQLFDRFRIEETNRWAAAAIDHPIGLSWRMRAGVESSYQRVGAESVNALALLLGDVPEPETAVDRVEVHSVYADLGWSPNSQLDFQFGLRHDDLTSTHHEEQVGRVVDNRQDDARVSPRVTLRWYPARGWTLRFLTGKTFRPPKPILAEVCCGQAYQDSSGTTPETGTSWGFETVFQPDPTWRVSLYAARTDFDDHILRLVAWSQFYIQTYALANVSEATADTLELAFRYSPGGFAGRLKVDGSIGWLSFYNRGERDVPVEVAPPSFGSTQTVNVPMQRIPYRPSRTGSLSVSYLFPRDVQLLAGASYTGSMLIQQFAPEPTTGNMLLEDFRETPSFWLVNAAATIPVFKRVDLALGVDNAIDELQNDLGDPTTDYNWGPLAGRTWFASLRFHLDG